MGPAISLFWFLIVKRTKNAAQTLRTCLGHLLVFGR
jgi:hypothetical protein